MLRHRTKDSSLAFFINQLDNLDKRLYEPLVSVTWGRDIKLRSGISMSQESTSFIRSSFAAAGTLSAQGKPWISPQTTTIPGVSVNGEHVPSPIRLLGREISYSSVELERSQNTQQPIDVQKMAALQTLYQMNTDEMVYVGDTDVSATGLVNDPNVVAGNVVAGISGDTEWVDKTADEILADVNTLLYSTYLNSAFAICPNKLLLPPFQFSYIASQKVSSAGNVSILKFLKENSICLQINGTELDIQPVKWLTGAGVDDTDRMVAYTNDESRIRFVMVPIRRETAYYFSINFVAPYIWAYGGMEFVYPETVQYADGI